MTLENGKIPLKMWAMRMGIRVSNAALSRMAKRIPGAEKRKNWWYVPPESKDPRRLSGFWGQERAQELDPEARKQIAAAMGKKGGPARAAALSQKRRREIAKNAVAVRNTKRHKPS